MNSSKLGVCRPRGSGEEVQNVFLNCCYIIQTVGIEINNFSNCNLQVNLIPIPLLPKFWVYCTSGLTAPNVSCQYNVQPNLS